jgi:hypothetical protein
MYYENEYGYSDYENCQVPLIDMRTRAKNIKSLHAGKGNLVYCLQDKYYRNGHLCSGMLKINDKGEVNERLESNEFKKYFFINGYMCKDEQAYDKLTDKCSDKNGRFDIKKFKSFYLSELVEFFKYPITTIVNEKERWILNSEYSTKCQTIGDKMDIDIFLSPNIITVRYDGEFTATTLKDVANVVLIKERELTVNQSCKNLTNKTVDKINSEVNETIQHTELVRIIKTDTRKTFRSNYFYTLYRIDIAKCNPSPEVKVHFFSILLKELRHFNVITEGRYNQLLNEGSKNKFESHELIKEIDKYIEPFYNKLNYKNEDKISNILSTIDKLNLLDNSESKITEEDVIKSIRDNNELFNNNNFNNDLLDYSEETFSKFTTNWVPIDTMDHMYPFAEAICLCLHKIGFINFSELEDILNNSYITLLKRTEALWNNWREQYKETSDKVLKNAKKIISEEIIEEVFSSEDLEKECKDEISNIVDSIKSYIQQVEVQDIELRTPWIEDSLNHMESTIGYIKRYLLKEEKQENEKE